MLVWLLNVARWAKCLVRYFRVLRRVNKTLVVPFIQMFLVEEDYTAEGEKPEVHLK